MAFLEWIYTSRFVPRSVAKAVTLVALAVWRRMPKAIAIPAPQLDGVPGTRLLARPDAGTKGLERAKQMNAMLSAVIGASPYGQIAVDGANRVTVWNPAAERIYGLAAADAIGRPLDSLAWPSRPQATGAPAEFGGGAPQGGIDLVCHVVALRGPSEAAGGRLFTVDDITRRKHPGTQARRSVTGAAAPVTEGAAHDLNNLLAIILGNLELCSEDLPPSSDQRRMLQEARNAALRGAKLTQHWLAESRPGVTGSAPLPGPGGEVILVVENDGDVRRVTVRMLTGLGYRTIEAADGEAALASLGGARRVDLILTDVLLTSGMNGLALLRAAQKRYVGLKIIFMSGYPKNAILQQGALDDHAHFVAKPFVRADLARVIRQAINEE